jgi:hypothetical protein
MKTEYSLTYYAQFGMVCVLATAVSWAGPADAQRGRGDMTPEQLHAIWSLQVGAVAQELGLSAEEATGLLEAYRVGREGQAVGIEQLSEQNLEGGERYAVYRKVSDEQRVKMEEAFGAVIPADKAAMALTALGTFDWRYDRYVSTVAELQLEPLKQQEALKLINAYTIDVTRIRNAATTSEERSASREARSQRKTELDNALAAVLSEAEQAKWLEASTRRQEPSTGPEPPKITPEQAKAKRDARRAEIKADRASRVQD